MRRPVRSKCPMARLLVMAGRGEYRSHVGEAFAPLGSAGVDDAPSAL